MKQTGPDIYCRGKHNSQPAGQPGDDEASFLQWPGRAGDKKTGAQHQIAADDTGGGYYRNTSSSSRWDFRQRYRPRPRYLPNSPPRAKPWPRVAIRLPKPKENQPERFALWLGIGMKFKSHPAKNQAEQHQDKGNIESGEDNGIRTAEKRRTASRRG